MKEKYELFNSLARDINQKSKGVVPLICGDHLNDFRVIEKYIINHSAFDLNFLPINSIPHGEENVLSQKLTNMAKPNKHTFFIIPDLNDNWIKKNDLHNAIIQVIASNNDYAKGIHNIFCIFEYHIISNSPLNNVNLPSINMVLNSPGRNVKLYDLHDYRMDNNQDPLTKGLLNQADIVNINELFDVKTAINILID